jgi:hypothetical protein
MPPKKSAKTTATSPARSKSRRKKKGPSQEKSKKIIELRDKLLESVDPTDTEKREAIGMACKGMYKCDKEVDEKCLDGILAKLTKLKTGGARKSRSKSRSRSRSRKAR